MKYQVHNIDDVVYEGDDLNEAYLQYTNTLVQESESLVDTNQEGDFEQMSEVGLLDTERQKYLKHTTRVIFKDLEVADTFRRGDKINFIGQDSQFLGYFVGLINKLPTEFNPEEGVRCVVQQKDTGILLIKGCPKLENKGWPND